MNPRKQALCSSQNNQQEACTRLQLTRVRQHHVSAQEDAGRVALRRGAGWCAREQAAQQAGAAGGRCALAARTRLQALQQGLRGARGEGRRSKGGREAGHTRRQGPGHAEFVRMAWKRRALNPEGRRSPARTPGRRRGCPALTAPPPGARTCRARARAPPAPAGWQVPRWTAAAAWPAACRLAGLPAGEPGCPWGCPPRWAPGCGWGWYVVSAGCSRAQMPAGRPACKIGWRRRVGSGSKVDDRGSRCFYLRSSVNVLVNRQAGAAGIR